MKQSLTTQIVMASLLVVPGFAADEEAGFASRLSLSPRAGFNISAQFSGAGTGSVPRTTPDGDAYNYDDGYVLTDISGNAGGQTWYWGYDDSAAQVSGDSILLSQYSVSDTIAPLEQNADPSAGAELVYQLQVGGHGRLHYGLEAGAAYQNVHVSANGSSTVTLITITDAYGFVAGGTPPSATPSSPYQGTYQGPGFLIDDAPSSSSSVADPNVTLLTDNELNSALWCFRVGPYFDYDVSQKVTIELSVGVAAGVLDAEVTWSDTAGAMNTAGSGSDLGILMGFYVGATASWQFAEHWSVLGGVQYLNLGTYEHDFDGRALQLDLNNTFLASLGVGWSF